MSKVDRLLERHGQLIVTLTALALMALAAHGRATPYNNYTLLADAFLHGRVWIEWPGEISSDALAWQGQHYVIEAPVPGLLDDRLALLFGKTANQTTLAILLGAVGVAAAWDL